MTPEGVEAARGSRGAVPDAVAPPPHHPRFPLFDGLRAIAVFCVLFVHLPVSGVPIIDRLISHLTVGVTIFFLISGFLLYRPFIAHRTGGAAPPRVLAYGKRRILRIFPAYWLAITAVALLPDWSSVLGGEAWGYYGLLHTLPFAPTCGAYTCGLPQTWSLVVELTFYAVLPLYFLVTTGFARNRTPSQWLPTELVLLGLLAISSVFVRYVLFHPGPQSWIAGTLAGAFLWFALGMGLAAISVACAHRSELPEPLRSVQHHPWLPWVAALGLYAALAAWLPPSEFVLTRPEQLVEHVVFGTVAALLLLPAVFGDREGGAPRRFLAHPVIAWLGLVSYGIFLWHLPFAVELRLHGAGFLAALFGTIALTVPVAALSYYAVERPILRLKYRRLLPRHRSRRPTPANARG